MGDMTKATLLWIDLEMTGLDVTKEKIIEVAAIATDWDFKTTATYEAVIHVDEKTLAGMDEWNQNQHGGSGLLRRVRESTVTSEQAEQQLLAFLAQNFDESLRPILAGNSIHQDRKFIDHEWPTLSAKLHYRMLDVSAWKVVFEAKYHKKFTKPENHRALDDIKGSIDELKYYLKKVKA